MLLVLIAALVALSCACRSAKDKVAHHYDQSVFSRLNPRFWDPSVSYRNKWKNGNKREGERFWGSSTIFVNLTDAWHLFSSLELLCAHLALSIGVSQFVPVHLLLILLGVKIIYALCFNFCYDYLLRKSRVN